MDYVVPAKDLLNATPAPPEHDVSVPLADIREGIPFHYWSPLFLDWIWLVRDEPHHQAMRKAGCEQALYRLSELQTLHDSAFDEKEKLDLHHIKVEFDANIGGDFHVRRQNHRKTAKVRRQPIDKHRKPAKAPGRKPNRGY